MVYSGSIRLAASWVSPASNGSIVPMRRFALYPPDTQANAQASPARGWRPIEWKMTAASGTRTTYPISDAVLEITAAKQMAMVTRLRGFRKKLNVFLMTRVNPLLPAGVG